MGEADDPIPPGLPGAVLDLAMRLGVTARQRPHSISLTQTGRMKRSLTSDTWMPFKARQIISTRRCEFDWHAKAGPFGLISGRDALKDGAGRFDIMALGVVPIARASQTTALVRGELMRYLAEIAWAPHAILCNPALRWRVEGPDRLSVSAGEEEVACEVMLGLDSDGRIASGFAPDRPRSATPPILPTAWRGHFTDYRLVDDIWLPLAGAVEWEIDGTACPYWHCAIDTWRSD